MNPTDFDAGYELLEYSRKIDHTEKLGPVTRLFPYIYEASQRMGVREISRWLSEQKKISISPSTISRALRFSDPQWEGFSSIIEPRIRTIEEFYDEGFLPRSMYFEIDEKTFGERVLAYIPEFETSPEPKRELGFACKEAADFLQTAWFSLDQATRAKCMPYLVEEDEEQE